MAIDRSQSVSATVGAASSLNVLFTNAVSAGSLIVAHLGYFSASAPFTSFTDNANANAYTVGVSSTMTSDASVKLLLGYKAGISSGVVAGSTYRVTANFSASPNGISLCAVHYTGGPWTVGSTGSSNGTSTGPRGPELTASSTPMVFVSGAVNNSTSVFASTVVGSNARYVTTVDPTNANQILNVIDSTSISSLAQQITHSMTSSTRWAASAMVFMGAGAGGAVTPTFVDSFSMLGCV